MEIRDLPTVNATLNSISTLLIVLGLYFIRTKRIEAHKRCMLSAVGSSTLFLISYLTYHAYAGSVPFEGTGWVRPVYFFILITHIILAAVIVPMVAITVILGLRDSRERHKKWARVTAPTWLYVSVTGVVIYWMLYHGDFS